MGVQLARSEWNGPASDRYKLTLSVIRHSEILSVKKDIALLKDYVSCVAQFVLITNIYHIKVLLVEEIKL